VEEGDDTGQGGRNVSAPARPRYVRASLILVTETISERAVSPFTPVATDGTQADTTDVHVGALAGPHAAAAQVMSVVSSTLTIRA
jgi:hypothetical protein